VDHGESGSITPNLEHPRIVPAPEGDRRSWLGLDPDGELGRRPPAASTSERHTTSIRNQRPCLSRGYFADRRALGVENQEPGAAAYWRRGKTDAETNPYPWLAWAGVRGKRRMLQRRGWLRNGIGECGRLRCRRRHLRRRRFRLWYRLGLWLATATLLKQ
ncbi:MAG: hypothetical protein L0191_10165, partial [Acidobacteria bacterium]|nr:hypothetical protein [Acidobacteriota bacterium]